MIVGPSGLISLAWETGGAIEGGLKRERASVATGGPGCNAEACARMSRVHPWSEKMEPKNIHVVFGATGGIGSGVVRRLVREGKQVALVARNRERLDRLAEETSSAAFEADVTDSKAVEECMQAVQRDHGAIAGVANCVGSLLLKSARLTSDEEWEQTIRTNLTSAFYVLRSAVTAMLSSGGSIVLMSSAAARIGLKNHEAIAAAKAGVEGLALSASASHARYGIRVNCVAPGLVDTPMTTRITTSEVNLRAAKSMHALGRIGQPGEVSSAICWLLNSEQQWVTGQVIGVDGGLGKIQTG